MATKKKARIPFAQLQENIIHLLNKDPLSGLAKEHHFPARFHIVYPSQGDYILLREGENKTVSLTKIFDIEQELAKFLAGPLCYLSEYQWSQKQIKSVVALWLLQTKETKMPKTWAWADDDLLTFHRLPWAKGIDGDFPTWKELLSRMSNGLAFMAWVGSLFFPESDRQTYVWLFGEGQNGKGSILRFLHNVFGNAFGSETVPKDSDKFWTYWQIGRRVVAFADTNDAGWPAGGLFKSLTGNDPIRVEIKGGAAFTAKLDAKFIFASNTRPKLSSELADIRRAVLCELGAIISKPDPQYEQKLWSEGGAFITACMKAYETMCPNHEPIQSDQEELLNHVGGLEDEFQSIVDDCLDIKQDNPEQLERDKDFILATDFAHFLSYRFDDARSRQDFKAFLERKYKIKRKRVRILHTVDKPDSEYRYVNAQLKSYVMVALRERSAVRGGGVF